jgi:hypothetical protein
MSKKTWLPVIMLLIAVGCASSPASSAPTASGDASLKLTPPWHSDEHFEYNIVATQDGSLLGTSMIDVQPAGDVTTIKNVVKIGQITQSMTVTVRSSDLRPLSGEHQVTGSPNDFSLTSAYQNGQLTVQAQTAQGTKNATVNVDASALDNDSLLMVLRGAPLADNFSSPFTLVVSANATQVKAMLNVVGKESVTVPAGTFETYKVELSFGTQKQTIWYEAVSPHRLIQYDNGTTKFVLTK